MAAPKGHQPPGGSRAGIPNKRTVEVKEALSLAFEKIGGIEAFSIWAKDNQTEYYKLYAKMLPRDLNVALTTDVHAAIVELAKNEEA